MMSKLPKSDTNLDPDVRILIALAGLALEESDKAKKYFSANEIIGWLDGKPEYGAHGDRHIKKKLESMRDNWIKIKDENGKVIGEVISLLSVEKGGSYFYRISGNTAETPLSAKLILRLEQLRDPYDYISKENEERIVDEIFNEFKSISLYKLSNTSKVAKKVHSAVKGFYFTRDEDNSLYPTTRIELEREFLEGLAELKPKVLSKALK